MSGKNQVPVQLNWQSTDPRLTLLPLNNNTAGKGSIPSGVIAGVMSGTNTIYSNIIDVSRMDNDGVEIAWTGTPTGTFSYYASVSGQFFFTITLTAANPAGSAGAFGLNLNQYPYKYFLIQYTNSSGSGLLYSTVQEKDLN